MSELRSVPPTVVEPPPAPGPSPSDRSPIPVLAEGTAPVAIRYRPAQRRVWPFVAAGLAVAAAAVGGYAVHAKREAREEIERQYPIAATSDEQAQLADGAERWSQGRDRLLATLAAFDAPELATLKGVGACTLATGRTDEELARAALVSDTEAGDGSWDDRDLDVTLRHVVLPGESLGDLAAIAQREIDHLIDAAERGRFQTVAGRDHILHAVGGAFVLVRVEQMRAPELDRANDAIVPGVRSGTAYAFDPSGALRCAGAFRATSSTIGPLSSFSGLDQAYAAATRDFEAQAEEALVSSLRSID